MKTDGSSHPSKPIVRTLFSFVFLIVLLFGVLLYDHSLIEQIRQLLAAGRWPDFAASTRFAAYLITTYVIAKPVHKFPGWLVCSASAVVFFLAALWLP